MSLIDSPTELTTAATDALLAIECFAMIAWLLPGSSDIWRRRLWCLVLGLFGAASVLGAAAHGLKMSAAVNEVLWKFIYLCLGIAMALFVANAVADWRGQGAIRRFVPWSMGAGAVFFGLTELQDGAFSVFVIYEAAALLISLIIYLLLAFNRRLKGAAVIAAGILLGLVAAVL